jgi:hypothetical protein
LKLIDSKKLHYILHILNFSISARFPLIDSKLIKLMTAVKLFKYRKGARIWKLFYQNSLKGYVKTRWRSIGTMLQSFVDT